MNKIEMYFLQCKFIIFAEKGLLKRFSNFWMPFLKRHGNYDKFITWEIHFFIENENKTIIDQEAKKILHYSNSICQLTELNNLFREAIVKISALYGVVWFHCSAVNFNEKTRLFLGEKGDGKTTLLLNYLKDEKCKFVGNDQLPLFIYNNKLCTLCWRPDIKLQSLNCDKTKELILVNNNKLSFIDFEYMSKRVGKKIIAPTKEYSFKYEANCIYPIDQIVVLDKNQEISDCSFDILLNKIDKNSECVLGYKLANLSKYMSYWNKRIIGFKVPDETNQINKKILNECKKVDIVKVGNRLLFENLKETLERRIK